MSPEQNYLIIGEVIISILLILAILMQERGSGLSATFGGSGNFYSSRRGIEKILLWATVILSVLFLGIAALFVYI